VRQDYNAETKFRTATELTETQFPKETGTLAELRSGLASASKFSWLQGRKTSVRYRFGPVLPLGPIGLDRSKISVIETRETVGKTENCKAEGVPTWCLREDWQFRPKHESMSDDTVMAI
jgi:hypothetical protein